MLGALLLVGCSGGSPVTPPTGTDTTPTNCTGNCATANTNLTAADVQQVIAQAQEDVATVPIHWPDSAMAISSDLRLDGYNAFWYNIPWATRGFGTA